MKAHPPVLLHLCTDEMLVVSEDWWRKFLLSQELMLQEQKGRELNANDTMRQLHVEVQANR